MKSTRRQAGKRDDLSNAAVTTADHHVNESYVLRLYVAGVTPRSVQAIERIKRLCEQHLLDRYLLEVIDVYQQPVLAKGDQIIAVPTLIRLSPQPVRTLIGDMSDEQRVLVGLDLQSKLAPSLPKGVLS